MLSIYVQRIRSTQKKNDFFQFCKHNKPKCRSRPTIAHPHNVFLCVRVNFDSEDNDAFLIQISVLRGIKSWRLKTYYHTGGFNRAIKQ